MKEGYKHTTIGKLPEDWEVVKLGTQLEKIIGGGTPSRDIPEYWNGNIPWATVKDLKTRIVNDTEEYISEKGLKQSASNFIPKYTLVIATRMALGKAVFFTKDVAINQDLKAIFPKKTLSKWYLFHWLIFQSGAIEKLGSGSTVKGIRLEVLKRLAYQLTNIRTTTVNSCNTINR